MSELHDNQTYLKPCLEDLRNAAESVLIVSSILRRFQLHMVLPLLNQAVQSGVQVLVRTRVKCEETALLESCGIIIETQDGCQQQSYAVIDRVVVWYGNIIYLAYSSREANALRFENADIAGELLELGKCADLAEQLSIEE